MVLRIANDWGRRCGADCVERWNATAGKAIGVSIAEPRAQARPAPIRRLQR